MISNYCNVKYPSLYFLSCSISLYDGWPGCESGLPTRWRFVCDFRKQRIVLPKHLDLILIRLHHCWHQSNRGKFLYTETADRSVCYRPSYLWNKFNFMKAHETVSHRCRQLQMVQKIIEELSLLKYALLYFLHLRFRIFIAQLEWFGRS